jgi:hypothetical protein
MTTFAEIVDAAEHLSSDKQAALLELLRRRIAARNRGSLVRDVAEASAEFQSGRLRAASAAEIIAEARCAS